MQVIETDLIGLRAVRESSFFTPFEIKMVGGTPSTLDIIRQKGHPIECFHIPEEVLKGNLSILEADRNRDQLGFFLSIDFLPGSILGVHNIPLAISLERLDLNTGTTLCDPRILGLWNPQSEQIKEVTGRDLTKEYYCWYKARRSSPDIRRRGIWAMDLTRNHQ